MVSCNLKTIVQFRYSVQKYMHTEKFVAFRCTLRIFQIEKLTFNHVSLEVFVMLQLLCSELRKICGLVHKKVIANPRLQRNGSVLRRR